MAMTTKVRTAAAAMLLAIALTLAAACSAQPASPSSAEASASSSAQASTSSSGKDAEYERALSGSGLVTGFIGEQFFDKAIQNEDDALAAAKSAISRIGGDGTTKLELVEIRPTETGTTYYTFRQQAGDVVVRGAAVKLIVDKSNRAVGLVSAIMPNIQLESLDSWEITQEQAERVVRDECAKDGQESIDIVAGATEQTLIPLTGGSNELRYAWVVYTANYHDNLHSAYLAHYVNADGAYLYSIGIDEPGNASALAGDAAAFAFDKMEQGTWSGTVTKHDGSTTEVTVPTLTNPETGDVILGDGKRKILCADYADFTFKETISPRTATSGTFADNEMLIYDTFIKVWDFYDGIGWTGPDGNGTPAILLMNMVDETGTVERNAYYEGRKRGFQTFSFNRDEADGECYDIIGHEFAHCVSSTLTTTVLYMNDMGAINEGISDVMGNLIEMLIAYKPEGAWLIGENEGPALRSMKDPHACYQPAFAWDAFFASRVDTPTTANDNGGVHVNSSLVNLISYKLDQAGMPLEDQVYFWMNVELSMTPSTDFAQLGQLLPWCMQQAGYPQYIDAVKTAVAEANLATTEAPSAPPDGCGFVSLVFPENTAVSISDVCLDIMPYENDADNDFASSWAKAGTRSLVAIVPAGTYRMTISFLNGQNTQAELVLTNDGWVNSANGAGLSPKAVAISAGETVELPSNGLEA